MPFSKIDVSGTSPKQVVEEIELYIDHTIGEYFFGAETPSPGSPIMLQLQDCYQLNGQYLKTVMSIEICYCGFLYHFQEIRFDVPGASQLDNRSRDTTPYVVLMFAQKTRMM